MNELQSAPQQAAASALEKSLCRMTPTSLAEIDSVALMNRVDTKYVMRDDRLPEVLDALRDEYYALEIAGIRCSPYSTLYFDTPAADCYLTHHNGKEARQKYRSRCYESTGGAFFEVKQRTNKGRTIKQRISVGAVEPTLTADAIGLAGSIAPKPVTLTPAMWTRFSRITLAGIAVAERVTLDVHLEFTSEDRRVELAGLAIVEVKQARDSRESPIRRLLRAMQIRPLGVSKYCVGRALLYPELKQNQFKEKLLAIRSIISRNSR